MFIEVKLTEAWTASGSRDGVLYFYILYILYIVIYFFPNVTV